MLQMGNGDVELVIFLELIDAEVVAVLARESAGSVEVLYRQKNTSSDLQSTG